MTYRLLYLYLTQLGPLPSLPAQQYSLGYDVMPDGTLPGQVFFTSIKNVLMNAYRQFLYVTTQG